MIDLMAMICSKPGETAERCRNEDDLLALVKTSLLMVLGCTGAFGLVLGASRDLTQALASAAKLPLVWILTLAVCAPAFYSLAAVLGHAIRLRALLALILAATARASLVLFALLPVLWLCSDAYEDSTTLYHKLTMLAAVIYALASLAALGVLLRGFRRSASVLPLLSSFAVVFLLVAGQTAWSLRPFVGRPAEADVPWFRPPEGTFLEALRVGADSARGSYSRRAPAPPTVSEAR